MTEYEIACEKVLIPTVAENDRCVRMGLQNLIEQVGDIFDKWYSSQYDCLSVYNNSDDIINRTIKPIIKKSVEMLNEQGVYSINEDIFIDKYYSGGVDKYIDVLDMMLDEISDIDEQKRLEKKYREIRKASRGRVVGGGFGLGGAIKGMATAGVMNATSGMVHSLGNAVGNIGSGIAASASKSAAYKNFKAPLRKAIISSAYNVRDALRKALENEANIKCEYVTSTGCSQAEAIVQNYKEGRIPKEHKSNQIIKALLLNPYDKSIYMIIWSDFGDKNGDLKKMASYFGCPIEDSIRNYAQKYASETYQNNCKGYLEAFNKKSAAIKYENIIKKTLSQLNEYCEKNDIDKNSIPEIVECKVIIESLNKSLCTVHGVKYETRMKAADVGYDFKTFYSILEYEKDLNDTVKEKLLNAEYRTYEFKLQLASLIEQEITYRNPLMISVTMRELLTKNLKKDTISSGWIIIPKLLGDFASKEQNIKSIVQLQQNETILLYFDRGGKGKSGVMLTNSMLRIYSKGLFSNENMSFNIDSVTNIECVDKDLYVVSFADKEPVEFSLKHGSLSVDEQICLGETFAKIIRLVKNLTQYKREQLYRFSNGIALCDCGTYLTNGEKICPGCGKMLLVNGTFAETCICPSCSEIIPKGKKFCSKCGYSFENGNVQMELNRCPNCSMVIKPGKKFCSNCGTKV